ncbi:DUF1579 domain-containing protein [Fontivita pretiosa]|uniref:DUF1579 domain-containing protein n=1 Tax=Fontivita pretiosa TaxID=2989684 RepID=UPI003D16CEBE
MKTEPQKEHQWLQQLVGQWTYESDCSMGPDQPRQKFFGSETVRPLGGLWVVCDGQGEMPGGEMAQMIMTLGYDPRQRRFVGTWIGSMMSHLWIYDGQLDAAQQTLWLGSEGPDFCAEGKMARFRDTIQIINPDERKLISHYFGPDGQWHEFMTAHYRRK